METIRFVQLKGEFEIKWENSYLHQRWLLHGTVTLIVEFLGEELCIIYYYGWVSLDCLIFF